VTIVVCEAKMTWLV